MYDKHSFFRHLNCVTGRTHRYSVKKVVVDDNEYTKPEDIAEKFNEHFSTIGQTINERIDPCSKTYAEKETEFSMFLRPTNPTEIIRIIQNLKSHKEFGPDGIPAEVIKHCASVLAPLLSDLINLSFSQGCFPSCLGAAKVIPLHKSGDKANMTNYRPISLLSVISKIFERVMYLRISEFLERHQLLSKSQFGFRSKRSCIDAIASIVERIRSDHSTTDYTCIFLDLQKAFDTVDHPR